MDRGAWQATIHGVEKGWTGFRDRGHILCKMYFEVSESAQYYISRTHQAGISGV